MGETSRRKGKMRNKRKVKKGGSLRSRMMSIKTRSKKRRKRTRSRKRRRKSGRKPQIR